MYMFIDFVAKKKFKQYNNTVTTKYNRNYYDSVHFM